MTQVDRSTRTLPTSGLKPERIGLTATLAASVAPVLTGTSPLKPERIGLRLRKLPGWQLLDTAAAPAIQRGFRFHRTETAQAFAAFVARMADERGERPVVAQSWNEVTVTVPGEGAITDRVFDFAESLMMLPPGSTGSTDGSEGETPTQPQALPDSAPEPVPEPTAGAVPVSPAEAVKTVAAE